MPCFAFSCLLASGAHSFGHWTWEPWEQGPVCFVHYYFSQCLVHSRHSINMHGIIEEAVQVFLYFYAYTVRSCGFTFWQLWTPCVPHFVSWFRFKDARWTRTITIVHLGFEMPFSSSPGFPSVSAATTLIWRPAFSRAWLRLLGWRLGIPCAQDLLSRGWLGPAALPWEAQNVESRD